MLSFAWHSNASGLEPCCQHRVCLRETNQKGEGLSREPHVSNESMSGFTGVHLSAALDPQSHCFPLLPVRRVPTVWDSERHSAIVCDIMRSSGWTGHWLDTRSASILLRYIHPYIHPSIHTYIHTYILTDRQTDIHTYFHTCIPTYLYAYIPTSLLRTMPNTKKRPQENGAL